MKQFNTHSLRGILVLMLFSLSACISLKPKPSLTKHYLLGEPASIIEGGVFTGVTTPIHVSRPELPTFLNTNRLTYREVGGELAELKDARWAEPLDEGLARALAEYLTPKGEIAAGFYPWPNDEKSNTRVSVHFHRIEANADGSFILVATWVVTKPKGKESRGQYVSSGVRWSVGEPATYIQAINSCLNSLASSIGTKL